MSSEERHLLKWLRFIYRAVADIPHFAAIRLFQLCKCAGVRIAFVLVVSRLLCHASANIIWSVLNEFRLPTTSAIVAAAEAKPENQNDVHVEKSTQFK